MSKEYQEKAQRREENLLSHHFNSLDKEDVEPVYCGLGVGSWCIVCKLRHSCEE